MGGLVSFEEIAVDGDGVVDCCGEWVLGRKAVEDRHDPGVGEVGDGDALGEGAGIGVEAAPVEVDENTVWILRGDIDGSKDADRNASDGGGFEVDGVDLGGGFTSSVLPGIGLGAALGECFGDCGVADLALESGLGFRAEGGGNRDNAGDVGGAVGVDDTGVGLRWRLLCCGEGGDESKGREKEEWSHDWQQGPGEVSQRSKDSASGEEMSA